jgi:ubiquinone/menaquinone biosynthesis C-methylase UbiE
MGGYLKIDEKMTAQEKRQQAQREEFKRLNPSWDDSMVIFSKLFGQIVRPQTKLLDLGCGRANVVLSDYRQLISEAVGIDASQEATAGNDSLDRIVIGNVESLPFADRYFDVVISQWTIEHFQNPQKVFAECYRVLKPSGYFLFVTPYSRSPIILAKRALGQAITRKILSLAYGREEKDCFETAYRANTASSLTKALVAAGFKKDVLLENPDPSYWGFNAFVFKAALLAEKLFPKRMTMHLVGRFQK